MQGYQDATGNFPWRKTLRAYLRALPVTADGAPRDRGLIQDTQDVLREMPAGMLRPSPWRPDLAFSVHDRAGVGTILVEDALTGERIGGAFRGLPVVFEAWRGQGVGAEIVVFSDLNGGFGLNPGRYSTSGFHARMGAHRRHIERAWRWCPQDIPADVMRDYEITPGGLARLLSPWGPQQHEEWLRSLARK